MKLFCEHRGIPEEYIKPKVEAGLFRWKRNHGDQSKPDECLDVVVIPFHSLPGKEHVAQQYLSLLDSGDGKTPALNLLCKILEDRQRILDQNYRAEMEEYENAEKDNKPREPKKLGGVYTTDYTIEGLFRDQRANGGCLVVNDEATSFFDNQNQYKSGKGTDRQQMLKLYDGARARKVRVNDVLTLEGSRISIAGGTQPEIFEGVFQGDGDIFRVDGSLFRFMMTYDRGFYPTRKTAMPYPAKSKTRC